MSEQPPAAESARRSRTSRAAAARRRTTVRRRAAVAVGVVALLVIGGILLLGDDVPLVDDTTEPGEFAFALERVQTYPISETPPAELRDATREAGAAVKQTMDELYFRAFVDTSSWGDYKAAFELFDGRAAAGARADADILTLGLDADDRYDALDQASGTLLIAVLTDRTDAPVTAVAEVRFEADAEQAGGTRIRIVSVGSFYLREVDGTWRVFGYRVDREDESLGGPSPTGSPS